MGRLKVLLNLVILAIGAFIAWHEFNLPPAAKPKPSPEPAPPPKAPPPKAPPAAAPEPRATRPEREETAATNAAPTAAASEAPASADRTPEDSSVAATPSVATEDAGNTEGVEVAAASAAARISQLADDPPVPDNAVAGDGSHACPEAFPIKGNATSRIYHEPGRPSYDRTIPEYCFATVAAAAAAGFRAPRH